MAIGTCLDAVVTLVTGVGSSPENRAVPATVQEDRGSKKVSTRDLSRAHPCKWDEQHGRWGRKTVGVLLLKQWRTQGT